MKNGELKATNEFEERPSFKKKIESMTKTLSMEIEQSLIRKKSFVKLEETPKQKMESEEIFHKIPTRFSMGHIDGRDGGLYVDFFFNFFFGFFLFFFIFFYFFFVCLFFCECVVAP